VRQLPHSILLAAQRVLIIIKRGERGGREKAIYKTHLFTGYAQN
jgi:hypothetical protein